MTKGDNIVLLDCTLRDGGYNNDWCFGHDALIGITERVISAGIDFIELGFLDQRRPFDINRSIMPDTDSVKRIYGHIDFHHTRPVGMIDFGTCGLSHIRPRSESLLEGIRVIFKKHLRHEAMAFCRQIKDMGYMVFSQLVSITSYTDEEMMDLIALVNEVKPYAVSIVDTYGLLHKGKLFHYYEMLERYLDIDIAIGYHSHNNFQLAYANSIELIHHHADNRRTLLCDGSLFGMGKGAGNAPLELLSAFMRENYGKKYQVSQLLEAIDSNILSLYHEYHWGYSLKSFIAASHDCHPNYVGYLLEKKTLSVKSIDEILEKLEGEAKLLYDRNYIERLYIDYQNNSVNDSLVFRRLEELFSGREVMVLGPGRTISQEQERILTHAAEARPYVISINYIPSFFSVDALFLTNSKRYNQQVTTITERAEQLVLIATSNLTRTNGNFDYTLDYESLIDREAVFMDNSLIMLLKVLAMAHVRKVSLAGFDGYASNEDNYYTSRMEYDFTKKLGNEINAYVNAKLPEFRRTMDIEFITSTRYKI